MSAKSVCDVGLHQSHEFMLALEKAGFTTDLFQQVINSRGNKLAEAMFAAATNDAQKDDRFYFVTSFEVVIPADYDHATCLAKFTVAHKTEFAYFNNNITDANFAGATTKLTPGRRFLVKVFGIKYGEVVSSDDCLTKIRAESGALVGAQGMTLAYKQGKNRLPKGKWAVSFDEKVALWYRGGCHGVPYVDRNSDGVFDWYLGDFEDDWGDGHCLLCFCDISA